mmetsp:Transcript_39659/g.93946  ORF Transcript_39659/g.93946 Transcript_39659/m.93946 type:complete len:275 (+) Transcript_39659:111-935(+)|eukprot:CAMPEP_0177719546 /NCGR_PEP_ID=MMETSP0484_2-20121128/16157_1 /TAXON_ID=354590 /ORGANISM="Rhodomonas lens, Strain RHODO" /LENGTH=274 /DNA_ID=CAMNT_0019231763 /DNA_START=43 /DNA_END=867 /DNA_ORIENTATION=+
MVKKQILDITYNHPFAAVTTSLWAKYDGHKYVREVDVLDRYIDSEGRLHSRRLLTMSGNLPAIFRPFVPVRAVHMVETVVVDPVKQTMHVETVNINCRSVLEARSKSSYHPTSDGTRYHIDIDVRAFPHKENEARQHPNEEQSTPSSWKVEWIMGGGERYIAGKMESWVAKKLLGNVSRGEKYIEGFCRRFRERHLALCDESLTAMDSAARAARNSKVRGRETGQGGATESEECGGGRDELGAGVGAGGGSLQQLMAQNTKVARLIWPHGPQLS